MLYISLGCEYKLAITTVICMKIKSFMPEEAHFQLGVVSGGEKRGKALVNRKQLALDATQSSILTTP